jgi:hypothetical protein
MLFAFIDDLFGKNFSAYLAKQLLQMENVTRIFLWLIVSFC